MCIFQKGGFFLPFSAVDSFYGAPRRLTFDVCFYDASDALQRRWGAIGADVCIFKRVDAFDRLFTWILSTGRRREAKFDGARGETRKTVNE